MADRCAMWWCRGEAYANGLCVNHYRNQQRHGDVQLRGDALALYGYLARTHVLLAKIVYDCLIYERGVWLCRYCGEPEAKGHAPNCIVVTAQALLPPSSGKIVPTRTTQPGGSP